MENDINILKCRRHCIYAEDYMCLLLVSICVVWVHEDEVEVSFARGESEGWEDDHHEQQVPAQGNGLL